MNRSITYIAALGLSVAGCKDDLRPVTATWTTASAEWQGKIDALKADDAEQTKKITGLCSTEGLNPADVAAKTCADLQVTMQSDKAQLDTLEASMKRHRALVDDAIVRGKKLEVEVLVDSAKAEMTPALARVTDNAQLRREANKTVQAALTQEFEAAKAAAIATEARAKLWKEAAADKKPLDLTAIRFAKGAALEPAEAGAQAELQQLLAWANTCPGLTFSITAHESKELAAADAKKLTDDRAAAVKKYLVDNGVVPTKIVSAIGSGSKKLLVEEPDPASEAAKAMKPEELEALRSQNRRITIQAINACAGERAEL